MQVNVAKALARGLALSLLLQGGCRGEPTVAAGPREPARNVVSVPAATEVRTGAAPSAPSATEAPSALPAAPVAAAALASSAAPAPLAEPALLASDGSPLPQTDERPVLNGAAFEARMARVADAIKTGKVELARSSFFPLVAYAQVKDVQKPERDYRFRLMAHFERDLLEYHRALGAKANDAEFVGVDVPEARAQWMAPGKEGNRLGYYRVLRSRLKFRLADGALRSLELTSMISWRGEWYVVHLHGFE